jgi:hypothetical protein
MQLKSRCSGSQRNSSSSGGCDNKAEAAEANAANDASTKADAAESNAIAAAAVDQTIKQTQPKLMP